MHGKTVLITGAARGIGAAAAQAVATRGGRVALVGLEGDELERTAASCGAGAAAFEADVTDPEALERAVGGTVERFGGIDAVVANAGIAGTGTILHVEPRAFERVIEVNLLGVYRTIHATLPHVIERRGYVLPVASVAAAMWTPSLGSYCASKAGVEALARVLHLEVAHLGVVAGVAYFSWIDTDMVRAADAHPSATGVRQRLKGPLKTTYSVRDAGEAIARGIEDRARTVCVPGWYRAVLATRTLARRVARREMLREAPGIFERSAADVAARGAEAFSRPVGPGGAAAMASRERTQESVGSRE
jgi:NAD(P)-dependent dehydrogenase (short-subunit alcohol dehydrogenase family)